MLWFFKRADEQLEIETRFDNDTREFVVTLKYPGGAVETERFPTLERCRARLMTLEQRLETEQWTNAGPPLFVPGGFVKPRLDTVH